MQLTRRALMGATAMGAVVAAGCQPKAQSPDLNALLDRISTNILKESPETATSLNLSVEKAGGPYADRLSDASREGINRYRGVMEAGLNDLHALNRAQLSKADAVSYDVVTTSFENSIEALRYEHGQGATSPYVVSQLSGSYTYVPDFLDSQHQVTKREDADAYLSRLSAFARMLDQETKMIGDDAAAGVTPPDFCIDKAIAQLSDFARKKPADTVLVTSLAGKLGAIQGFPAADRTTLMQAAEAKVRDEVLPAYQRQIEALRGIRAHASSDAGCWRLPNGDALYATALKANTTTNMTPDEVHQMGVQLAQSINAEMDTILKAQGLTRGSVAERVQSLFHRPDQMYPNNDAGRAQIMAYLQQLKTQVEAKIPDYFGVVTHKELRISRVPTYIEAGQPEGYYQQGSLDGTRPGTFYINLRDTREVPKFTLPTLFHHEAIPGHHFQISIQQEQQALPFIRSALLGFNAYAEGWALYAEQLSDEMGLYADDPWGRLGYLKDAAFRASRLVVDSGMHAKHWTREQAIRSMMEVTGDVRSSTETEIDRYCVWPGQACGYMVGRQTFNRLRDEAKQALGSKFDIKGFHDAVLTNGSTPLSVSEALVHDWTTSLAHS
ncbi:MAG TPA: DUF885 family protein [Caulobacterales bacterium]|nr:DUF885 family protein [Caulobacterales bacterium]